MFRPLAVKALIGVGVVGMLAGTAALVATAAPSPAAGARPDHHKDRARGTIVKVSSTELTIAHRAKSRAGAQAATEEVTFALDQDTKVYKRGDKDKKDLGVGALKPGMRVGVRFEKKDGKKLAKAVVILPDARAGEIVSKDADGHSFTIKTRDGKTVHVTTSDKTRFVEGRGKARKQGSYADLKVGDRVVVLGEEDSQHNFDAAVVRSGNADHAAKPAAQ